MIERGATGCLHDTDPKPVRTTFPGGGSPEVKWYRCKKCGNEFSERFPTVIFQPPGRDQ